jgi:hypothetical protein
MKKTLIALTLTACSFQVFSQAPSQNEERFCRDREDSNFVKDLTMDSSNLMAFTNHGGLVNGGVCWWHSRFQRNALYLTIFKPQLPKPSDKELSKIIRNIRTAEQVVVIPGFKNFAQFSDAYEVEIQKELEYWQKLDGIARFAWIKGLSGSAEVAPEKLNKMMDQLYTDVEVNKNIAYNMLQIPGIVSHAWLVVHMEKVSGGYNLEILDSNFARRTEIYRFRAGDTRLSYHAYFNFVPYLMQTSEMDVIKRAQLKLCNPAEYAAIIAKEAEAERERISNM